MFGFTVAGVMLHVVSGALLSRCVGVAAAIIMARGCCGCRLCSTWVLRPPSLWRMGVAAIVVAVHGCCSHCCHDAWVLRPSLLRCVGVAVAVVAAHGYCGAWVLWPSLSQHMGVVATVIVPRRVSWVLSSLRVVPVLATHRCCCCC